jgi:hypothetical protein
MLTEQEEEMAALTMRLTHFYSKEKQLYQVCLSFVLSRVVIEWRQFYNLLLEFQVLHQIYLSYTAIKILLHQSTVFLQQKDSCFVIKVYL